MKIKDIKDVLEFLNQDEMEAVKIVAMFIVGNCPDEIGLEKYDHREGCKENENCFECWIKSLELAENQNKLENEI